MSLVDIRKLGKSFRYAFRGFWFVFKSEQNLRIQIVVSMVVIALMVVLKVTLWQAIILLMVMMFVLVLELINTIFEKLVDMLQPRIHFYAEVIKDVMAAAVLVSSAGAIIVGILVFAPYIWSR
ncbi:MAG: diacylglycerol kinase family protein [Patescibacteria group bacterium]|nr:diacylglycerol kinase family protein [Patescibacteria group bacterium]MDD5715704.1 diacylglycerol kinase family protein [Patescibacteria group bacterium]